MIATGSSEPHRPRRALRRAFAVFLVVLVVIVTTFMSVFGASLYESGRVNAVSKAAALEQYVRRSLEVSAVVAGEALDHLRRRGSVEGLADDHETHRDFAVLVASANLSEGMIFVDAEGMVLVHSGSFPAPPVDLSDRAWFRAHVAGADRVIDGSFISRVTGTLLFVHTFALRDDDGGLLGAVNIGIPSDALIGAQALPFTEQGIVTRVVKETGELIARDPFPEVLIGARLALPDELPDGAAILEVRETDRRRAVTAYSRLEDVGLVASVSIPLAVVLQPLMLTAGVTLPLLALIIIGGLVMLRHLETQQGQLRRSAMRLNTVLEASNLGAWQWSPKTDTSEFLGRWAEMLGYRQEDVVPNSSTWRRLLHPEEKDRVILSLDRHLQGETEVFREEHRLRHKDGHWVWVLDSGRVVERDAEGRPELVIGIHLDITERREAEERMRAVSLEVDHRSKNLLAVVQSLVSMTRADDINAFKATLRGRIHALARAHDLLSRSRWRGADLHAIAEEELRAYDTAKSDRVTIRGPKAVLGASAIQALAMTLHELATNAAKYGALSVPEGRLRLEWRVPEEVTSFEILWEESLDPGHFDRPDEAGRGFGSRLIAMMIETQLGGELDTEWTAHGLRCTIRVPKALLVCPLSAESTEAEVRPLVTGLHADGTGVRLLLVEDEALIQAETAARIEEAGHVVAATASSLQEAKLAAAEANIAAAVLDVNLGGELSFPVADILRARGVPFVFVTGYQPEGLIPERFSTAPVVRKPSSPGDLERALAEVLSATAPAEDPAMKAS
jgi:PAS domain S-box-containing protein